jgi:hypothetical protein
MYLQEDKIECSAELGDMTAPYSPQLALAVYLRAGDSHEKVIHCFMQTGGPSVHDVFAPLLLYRVAASVH